MPVKIKTHCFWLIPEQGTADDIARVLKQFASKGKPREFTAGFGTYLACEAEWHAKVGALTTTVFRLRSSALPSAVKESGVTPLPIDDDTNLGEPMCFAYFPEEGAAIVHYSHTGARHSVIPDLLSQLGFPHPVRIEPILRTDMLERLNSTGFVRSLVFSLHRPQANSELRAQGAPVAKAIDVLNEVEGVNIRVEVSVGHEHRGLILDAVKGVARKLMKFGDAEVTALQLNAAEKEDERCERLDLLGGRIEFELSIADKNRELDRADCHKKLLAGFKVVRGEIKKQQQG
jgi:hypothetical protein